MSDRGHRREWLETASLAALGLPGICLLVPALNGIGDPAVSAARLAGYGLASSACLGGWLALSCQCYWRVRSPARARRAAALCLIAHLLLCLIIFGRRVG
ncbi:MAG: hypothetical protein ACYC55_09140 [Candidatus Geothermincolia bacterium]